jgi:predicted ATPase/DNA-binding XRE family transcriptional regulator
MDSEISFGHWLQKRRKALDLTREELARKIGCSASALRKIETNVRHPSKQLAQILASTLDIPVDEHENFIKIARGELPLGRINSSSPLPDLRVFQSSQTISNPIPILSTALIGRERELSALRQMLADPQCRLITLVGPGGIGKTSLALEIACDQYSQYKDGVAFVSMEELDAPSSIVPAIADALAFSFQEGIDAKKQLINHMRSRQMLLVLDNAEHLLEDVSIFTKIIQSAPHVKLLCTSREPLNLHSEWVLEVRGLPYPQSYDSVEFEHNSAVTLFLHRAKQVKMHLNLKQEDRIAITHICKMVEGIPLAIELSAAWTRTLSYREIAMEIEKSLDFLSTNMRDIPERHQSLRAVFNHSWKLLTDEERDVLMKLAVFQGGFTREMAEQVADANLVALGTLKMKSLIQQNDRKRYYLHEMVRQYAHTQLQFSGEAKPAYSAHLSVFVCLAETMESELTRSGQSRRLLYMETEHDNFRVALRWAFESGDTESALRLTGALWRFWYMRSHLVEGSQWLEQALQAASTVASASLRAKVLNGAGLLAYYQGRFNQAEQWLEECLSLQSDLGERDIAYAKLTLAWIVHDQLGFARASLLYQDTLQSFRRLDDFYGMVRTLNSQGVLAFDIGDLNLADQLFNECMVLARQYGDKENVAVALTNLGWTAALRGQVQAVELCQEAITLFCELGNKLGIAFSLEGVAAGFILAAQAGRAVRLLGSADALRAAIDAPLGGTHARCLEQIIQQGHETLSDPAFAVAWAEGEAMSMEKAIAYAIGVADRMKDYENTK